MALWFAINACINVGESADWQAATHLCRWLHIAAVIFFYLELTEIHLQAFAVVGAR